MNSAQFNDASVLDDIWMEVLLSDPKTQINGLSIIADCRDISYSIVKWLIPSNCKVGAKKLESLPVKNWTIHVVNMGSIMRILIMIIKPFLSKSTIDRVKSFLIIFYLFLIVDEQNHFYHSFFSISVQVSQSIPNIAWICR